jgi:hypothetical protein
MFEGNTSLGISLFSFFVRQSLCVPRTPPGASSPLLARTLTMYLMYTLDENGKRVYTLKVRERDVRGPQGTGVAAVASPAAAAAGSVLPVPLSHARTCSRPKPAPGQRRHQPSLLSWKCPGSRPGPPGWRRGEGTRPMWGPPARSLSLASHPHLPPPHTHTHTHNDRNTSATRPRTPPTRPASRPTTSSAGSGWSARSGLACCPRSGPRRTCDETRLDGGGGGVESGCLSTHEELMHCVCNTIVCQGKERRGGGGRGLSGAGAGVVAKKKDFSPVVSRVVRVSTGGAATAPARAPFTPHHTPSNGFDRSPTHSAGLSDR